MKKTAILLIGPTGSGKTPLGDYIAQHGLNRIEYAHFDFGELLRQTAAGTRDSGISSSDVRFLKDILEKGALLEKQTFYLAKKIITHFNRNTPAKAVVLNGLPRHVDQAKDVAPWFDIQAVLRLQCSPEVVMARILTNAGNDRTARTDDALLLVQKKLQIFIERTAPLCDWFAANGVPVIDVPILVSTSPESIVKQIENNLPSLSF
ncbi:MAG: nucleoside monophosphate kinase [Deltaproteobacteria bacterium]|nr:nucleoside monophosphate kinase [Deltaproteobacteria bacterium]